MKPKGKDCKPGCLLPAPPTIINKEVCLVCLICNLCSGITGYISYSIKIWTTSVKQMPSSCLRSTLLCPSRGMGEGGVCRSYSSRRKTVRKYYMRPQTLGEARRQRRNISRNSFFHRHVLTGRPQWAAGALVLIPLQCWDSRHQWLTHAGSWLTLAFFHPKLFLFFFFSSSSMNFLLFFPDTVCGWNSGVIVSKFPGPVQGQEPVVKE